MFRIVFLLVAFCFFYGISELKASDKVIRHLAVPYAGFVTGDGRGLDVDLIKAFSKVTGREYKEVRTTWEDWISHLTGKKITVGPNGPEVTGEVSIRGDLAAHGITVLEWRKAFVDFSIPTFPTQVWIVAKAESDVLPISPSKDLQKDISQTRSLLKGRSLLGIRGLCVDPALYNLKETGALIRYFEGSLNDIAPAVLKGEAELALLDAPDAMMAFEKWPGQLKIIGPVTEVQDMAIAFPKGSVGLRDEFNMFFQRFWESKRYKELVMDYYPHVLKHFPQFFQRSILDVK